MKHKKQHKPKKTKSIILKIVFTVLCIIVVTWVIFTVSQKEAVVSVNGQKIIQDYINKQNSMNFNNQPMNYDELINNTINKVLLLQDAKSKGIRVSNDESEKEINSFLENRMLTKQELESRLKTQGLSWDDFKQNYKEQMVINKLLSFFVFNKIKITDIEIALYYKEHKDEINGNFDDIKENIRKTVEQDKKQELLDNYTSNLLKNAKIEYFGEYKKTRDIEELAKCLSNKAVLYGASWCPHCTNQKKIFGSAVKYITFVDCELNVENQNLCIEKGLQAYPTWEINNKLYLGEKSFKELAKLSGCKFSS